MNRFPAIPEYRRAYSGYDSSRPRDVFTLPSVVHHGATLYCRRVSGDDGPLPMQDRLLIVNMTVPEDRAVLVCNYTPKPMRYFAVARDPLHLTSIPR